MGFPFSEATWDGVTGPIFMGYGSAMPGLFTVISICLCIGALVVGQMSENKKYSGYKQVAE